MLDSMSSLPKPLVLVVEDEAALATMLRYNLEKQGFRVEEAGDGEEALTRISEAQPDLVLLDWMLPVMSGIEVCRQIRRKPATRDLPVIMVTARTEDQDAVRGLNTGADDYITKPFSIEFSAGADPSAVAPVQRGADEGAADFPRHRDGPIVAPCQPQRPPGASGPDRVPVAGIFHAASPAGVLPGGVAGRGMGAGHSCRAAHR